MRNLEKTYLMNYHKEFRLTTDSTRLSYFRTAQSAPMYALQVKQMFNVHNFAPAQHARHRPLILTRRHFSLDNPRALKYGQALTREDLVGLLSP